MGHRTNSGPEPEMPTELQQGTDRGPWDEVDEAAWESFPASDPPAHAPRRSERVEKTVSEGNSTRKALLERLGRELLRAETTARLLCRREAERLGDVPPARPLLECTRHADEAIKTLSERSAHAGRPLSIAAALFGALLSEVRDGIADRLFTGEQSYRGTLLAMKQGVDLVKMTNQVAQREGDYELIEWTDIWLRLREPMVFDAEAQLGWFADHVDAAKRVARPLISPPSWLRRAART